MTDKSTRTGSTGIRRLDETLPGTLARGESAFLDCYNRRARGLDGLMTTLSTRIAASNNYWLLLREETEEA